MRRIPDITLTWRYFSFGSQADVADDTRLNNGWRRRGSFSMSAARTNFAKSIDEQRAQVAAFAKELGIAELPQN